MHDPKEELSIVKSLAEIRRWSTINLLAVAALVFVLVFMWLDIRSLSVRVRWIERKMDQGHLLVVDAEAFEEWRKRNARQ
jgi:hypothetical protein